MAQDIVAAGHKGNCHCTADCHCAAKLDQRKAVQAEALPGTATDDLGGVVDDREADYARLVGEFHQGAYYKHHSWKDPPRSIVLTLLHECVAEDEVRSTEGIAALQLLPGLVEYCRGQRKKKEKIDTSILIDSRSVIEYVAIYCNKV